MSPFSGLRQYLSPLPGRAILAQAVPLAPRLAVLNPCKVSFLPLTSFRLDPTLSIEVRDNELPHPRSSPPPWPLPRLPGLAREPERRREPTQPRRDAAGQRSTPRHRRRDQRMLGGPQWLIPPHSRPSRTSQPPSVN